MDIGLQKKIDIGLNSKSVSSNNPIVEIVLIIIVSVLFFWFIILPKQSAVAAQKTQLDDLTKQQTDITNNLATLRTLIAQLKSNKQDVSHLDQAIPLNGKTIDLQLLIQNLANLASVTIGNISISNSSEAPVAGNQALLNNPYGASRTLQKLSGSVVVTGSFSQIKMFLNELENSGRIMDISSISIDAASLGNLNLKVVLSAYYLAP